MEENIRSFNCEKHPQQKVMFVCAVNDWHFQPLCQLCTPTHTQNHAKRLKINLQSFDEINKKVTQKQGIVSQSYEKQIQEIKALLKNNNYENLSILKDLKAIEEKIIEKIRSHFAQLYQKTIQKLKSLLDENTEKLKQLQSNLSNEITFIHEITKPEISLDVWKNSAKKIYSEEKLESYLQESKEIIEEFKQKKSQITNQKKKQLFVDENKFFNSLNALISPEIKYILGDLLNEQNIKGKMNQNDLKKPLQGQKDQIKKPIIKPKRKTCKNCNQQMQYLTENKKHLICRYCNFKQRNYIKKSI